MTILAINHSLWSFSPRIHACMMSIMITQVRLLFAYRSDAAATRGVVTSEQMRKECC